MLNHNSGGVLPGVVQLRGLVYMTDERQTSEDDALFSVNGFLLLVTSLPWFSAAWFLCSAEVCACQLNRDDGRLLSVLVLRMNIFKRPPFAAQRLLSRSKQGTCPHDYRGYMLAAQWTKVSD